MGAGPLVERGCACGAVLAAQARWTGHVVVRHHRGLYWLQGLVGGVAPGWEGERERERERKREREREGGKAGGENRGRVWKLDGGKR